MRKLDGAAVFVLALGLAWPVAAPAQDAFSEAPKASGDRRGAGVLTVASAEADAAGEGVVGFEVDPTAGPDFVAQEIRQVIQLSRGAVPQSITVQEGFAEVGFSEAVPFATVEATMPAEIAASIGAGGTTAARAGQAEPEWVVVGEAVAEATGGGDTGGPVGEFSDEGW